MGVDYYIICRKHKEKVWIYSLPSYESEAVVKKFLRGTLTMESLENIPVWAKHFLNDMYIGRLKETAKFRERHPDCKLILMNDHMDHDDDEIRYYAEVDYDSPVDRTEVFLENIRTKSPMSVRSIVSMEPHKVYRKIIEKVLSECSEAKFVLKNSLPWGYLKREDLILLIPVKEYLGGYEDVTVMAPPGEFQRDVFRTCDGRLFYTVQNTHMGWLTEEEFKTMKEEGGKLTRR